MTRLYSKEVQHWPTTGGRRNISERRGGGGVRALIYHDRTKAGRKRVVERGGKGVCLSTNRKGSVFQVTYVRVLLNSLNIAVIRFLSPNSF